MKSSKSIFLSLVALVALVAVAGVADRVSAQTRFVNLSRDQVHIAKYSFIPYSSRSGDLTVVQPAGWAFSGWYTVKPGESIKLSGSHFHVRNKTGRINWKDLKESDGFIKRGSKFNAFVGKGTWNQDASRLLRNGYTKVKFQTFGKGPYKIGRDYRVVSRKFTYDLSSRSIKFHMKKFEVPGKVVDFKYNATKRGSSMSWTQGKTAVSLTGSTEGAQHRPFGPREPGYYKGSVTVYYTVRN